ncbi:hypothetical protein GCM10027273_10140 [Nocardioides pakistanensis]
MAPANRQPAGTPPGGQFAAASHAESEVDLTASAPATRPWSPRTTTHSKVGPTCSDCDRVHGADAAAVVGRFDEAGPRGYRSRLGGPLRATREEAVADYCAAHRASAGTGR